MSLDIILILRLFGLLSYSMFPPTAPFLPANNLSVPSPPPPPSRRKSYSFGHPSVHHCPVIPSCLVRFLSASLLSCCLPCEIICLLGFRPDCLFYCFFCLLCLLAWLLDRLPASNLHSTLFGGGGGVGWVTDCRNLLSSGPGLRGNWENTVRISEIIFTSDDACVTTFESDKDKDKGRTKTKTKVGQRPNISH